MNKQTNRGGRFTDYLCNGMARAQILDPKCLRVVGLGVFTVLISL